MFSISILTKGFCAFSNENKGAASSIAVCPSISMFECPEGQIQDFSKGGILHVKRCGVLLRLFYLIFLKYPMKMK